MFRNPTNQDLKWNCRRNCISLSYHLQMESSARKVSDLQHFARRVAGYAVSAILASLIYVVWLTVTINFVGVGTTRPGLIFGIGFAFFFLFAGGFALALLLMIVPWAIAVWAHFKTLWDGRIYFPGVGAVLVFTLGCTTASIVPKPFWVDDQTFFEGALIAAQRQGVGLLLSGIAFGACYFWLERRIRARL